MFLLHSIWFIGNYEVSLKYSCRGAFCQQFTLVDSDSDKGILIYNAQVSWGFCFKKGKKPMFYTKYRPQKFNEISKPNETAEALMNQVATGKVSHAYLFHGPRGTGKTTTARILAKAVNCLKLSETGDPCGKCEVCSAVQNGSFVDMIEIDAASNRGIDDIRELRERVKLAPSSGKKKIYIIDEVHMLTNEAFNALLKTLEEPPSHTIFILATTEFHKVPETVKSRCQVFKFKRATVAQIVERLEKIARNEKAKIGKDELKKIAEASLGGFRDADTLLQQVLEGNLNAGSLLNVGSVGNYADFIDFIRKSDISSALTQVNQANDEGVDLYVWTGELIKYLRDLLFITAGAGEGLLDVSKDVMDKLNKQSESLNPAQIIKYIDSFSKAQNAVKSSFITQLPVELAIIESSADFRPDFAPPAVVVVTKTEITEEHEPATKEPKKEDQNKKEEPEEETKIRVKIKKEKENAKEEDEDKDAEPVVALEKVQKKWPKILDHLLDHNSSVQALLKLGTPVSVVGNTLFIEVFYAFHKERLESPKNRKMVENALKEILNEDIRIKCSVSQAKPAKKSEKEVGELTDYNVVLPPAKEGSTLDIFDGGLPLG
ncbi:DNA polymerase III, subunit gamma and tau [candidate division WWE3 bacterium RIFCSPLOWO2_01_FULL_41_9]|uniref:DNA polymerase III subunit gamma/tau n=1 Tax=candidate division WWE3 bacterium RIFCSPLOWO2_01_FULL_41_9 TaxID=1802626 RepID=A0A1F4VIE2_UNCKA|nr:MAG: DNA polymerase III, subunit gamma and tau [candidate division WWE3 bacterium RIFCSPLOWO2_01_FULL_41_9]